MSKNQTKNSVINFYWRTLHHATTVWISFCCIWLCATTTRLRKSNRTSVWVTKNVNSSIYSIWIFEMCPLNSYTRLLNLKLAPHFSNSQLVLSANSSPTLNSRFRDWDQHLPGWSGCTPDSPAIQTARSTLPIAEITTQNIKANNAKSSFILFICVTVDGFVNTEYLCRIALFSIKLRWSCFKWREQFAFQNAVGQIWRAISSFYQCSRFKAILTHKTSK